MAPSKGIGWDKRRDACARGVKFTRRIDIQSPVVGGGEKEAIGKTAS